MNEFNTKLIELLERIAGSIQCQPDERVIELFKELKEMNEQGINDYQNQITQLKQQLAQKDEEIKRLKFFEKAYYYNQLQASQEDRQKFQNLANQGAVNINYIAIQKLEKLRNDIWELDIGDYYLQNGGTIENIKVKRKDVCDLIDNQIKELKGE